MFSNAAQLSKTPAVDQCLVWLLTFEQFVPHHSLVFLSVNEIKQVTLTCY